MLVRISHQPNLTNHDHRRLHRLASLIKTLANIYLFLLIIPAKSSYCDDSHSISVETNNIIGETDSLQHERINNVVAAMEKYSQSRGPPKPERRDYLDHKLAEEACGLDRGCARMDRLNSTYLGNCMRYKLENLLSSEILMSIMHDSTDQCERTLDEFIQLDEMIEQFNELFKKVLSRYNCHNGYSVKWNCDDCKKAYKDWLCATNLPYYMKGERIKPCISFCERVEQRCPYLHPIAKEQYGGQPVFICRDPNIPFVPEITPDIPYSEPAKCYDLCHISENKTELSIDSLSKYKYDSCPNKSSIAMEVRKDPEYCGLDQRLNTTIQDEEGTTEYFNKDLDADPDRPTSGPTNRPDSHVHVKKINELKEVLAVYKSQPKTQSYAHQYHRRA